MEEEVAAVGKEENCSRLKETKEIQHVFLGGILCEKSNYGENQLNLHGGLSFAGTHMSVSFF